MFLQMVMKSMRDAVPSNGVLDTDQTRLFQSLQDQQMSTNLAQGRGVGLADVIYRQLGGDVAEKREPGTDGLSAAPATGSGPAVPPRTAIPAARPRDAAISAAREPGSTSELAAQANAALDAAYARRAAARGAAGTSGMGAVAGVVPRAGQTAAADATRARAATPGRPQEFVNRVWAEADEASRATGIPARFVVAQAALETGWGRAELRHADGRPSYNLFNIKAGANWKGPVVEVPVTEYANGRKHTEIARFRAYGSYEEAFRDYANLLQQSPRYAKVLGQTDAKGFARSLQQAGYATDPMYADKLARIIDGRTLRSALLA
ncbi:flagellar assembly peptidoglycan hydrolase FlgJ [Aromatoleum sp.]|uniref:flagellar assembly peptidoglycan hydrolase FlgJ n=1 Tax=Aromatoleum sp. TaxID=2307007 RepID=UPI003FA53F1F